MLNSNFLAQTGKIFLQIIGKIIYFPIWWYSLGFGRLIKSAGRFWRNQERSLGFLVWVKNIFVPMYGQRDWMGRIISFVVRLVQIIARGIALLFWSLILILILLLWLVFPFLLIVATIFQLIAV